MKITKGTIIRTILLLMVIVNFALERAGVDLIPVSESGVAMFVETVIEIAVIAVAWWKNNSFSENAIKADKFLNELRNSEAEYLQ
jgi:SPP1 family holin